MLTPITDPCNDIFISVFVRCGFKIRHVPMLTYVGPNFGTPWKPLFTPLTTVPPNTVALRNYILMRRISERVAQLWLRAIDVKTIR